MPLLDLTLWRRWQAAHQGVNASQAQETTVREQVVLLVVSQYLAGMRAEAAVKAAQSRVDLAQALYDQANDLQKHGVGTGIDTLRANVELQNEKQRLLEAADPTEGRALWLGAAAQFGSATGNRTGGHAEFL